ncbi:MAG: protease pro-enzyme activation domain-containing protein, partial [Solirubrobacteraceae bacterium]
MAATVGAVALAGAALASSAPTAPPGALHRTDAVTAAPKLPKGARAISGVSTSLAVSGAVALKLRNQTAVERFIADVTNRHSPDYGRYLARGQFAKQFGPTQATIRDVEAQLRTDGLRVTGVSPNGILVDFTGSAATVEAAFDTGLDTVRLADGSLGRATTSAVRLPAAIASQVQSVVGLDQLVHETGSPVRASGGRAGHAARTASAVPHIAGAPTACADASALDQDDALTDDQVANSYGLDPLYAAGDLGAGQTVDIYELEPFDISDVQAFDECYFGQDNTDKITVTKVDGGPGTGPGSAEAALDVEDVSAIAPDAHIHVFTGPNMDEEYGPLDTWNAIAVADDARQITTSWGTCETELQQGAPGTQQVENEIFEQTAAQGQTVFSAAGDDGSDDCAAHNSTPVATDLSADDPASQPYVTAVGGTTILDATDPPVETVWNNGTDGGAGGGGISESWAMPSWQTAVAVAQTSADEACSNDPSGTANNYHLAGIATILPAGTACRELPDVSALADPQSGITIYYAGAWTAIGGTSSATPLWAAMLAEINASSSCDSAPVGFASPLLYQVADSSPADYADAFNDITAGNNDNLGVGDGDDYPAGSGYDMASGLGTPRITNANGNGLDQQLCAAAAGAATGAGAPQVTGLTPSSGSNAGGGTTVIAGTGFGSTQGAVYFGTVPEVVGSWSPTSITVDIPPYDEIAPPSTPAGYAGRALITVVTSGSQSSAPSANSMYEYTASLPSGGPVVDYISAPNGPTAGGNQVEIVGSGLSGATGVTFGDRSATITSSSDNELEVTVPASDGNCAVSATQGVCAVAVTVTTPAGTSSGPSILPAYQGPIVYAPNGAFAAPSGCGCEVVPQPEEYDYANAPTISSVSPSFMSENGTSTAVITGTGFNLLTLEWTNVGQAGVNDSEDFDLEGVSPTSLSVGIPAAAPTVEVQPVDLSVQSAGQLSNIATLDYAGAPTVTSISTSVVPQSGRGTLTVTGTGLSDVQSVMFQSQLLPFLASTSTDITGQSDTQLTVSVPTFYATSTDVLLCSVTGCSLPDPATDTLSFAYSGQPVVSSSAPLSGPEDG